MYEGNEAYGMCGGVLVHMLSILSGVLHGCPLSGTLFVLGLDLLLWMLQVQPDSSVIRACADDIGAALRRLEESIALAKIVNGFKSAARLTLKPPKCILVLTVHGVSDNGWNTLCLNGGR